jgi:hypothetical protein
LREEFPLGSSFLMERNAVGAVNIATHWCSTITRQNAGAPYGAPQLSWFSRSPVYLFASHHIVGASTARMTIGIQMNHAAPAYSPLSVFAIIRTL